MDTQYNISLIWNTSEVINLSECINKLRNIYEEILYIDNSQLSWFIPDGKSKASSLANCVIDKNGINEDLIKSTGLDVNGDFSLYLWNGLDVEKRINMSVFIPGKFQGVPPSFCMYYLSDLSLNGDFISKIKILFNKSISIWNPVYGRVVSRDHSRTGHPSAEKSGWLLYAVDGVFPDSISGNGVNITQLANGKIVSVNDNGYNSMDLNMINMSQTLAKYINLIKFN